MIVLTVLLRRSRVLAAIIDGILSGEYTCMIFAECVDYNYSFSANSYV